MKRRVFSVIFLFVIADQSFAEEIKLADASASASVVRSTLLQAGYRISIEFRPVTAMDEISNREMSETLAQFYAEEALSGFLHSSKAVIFSKVKFHIESAAGCKAQGVFDVPSEAIIDAPVRNVEIREEIIGKNRTKFKVDASTRLLDFRSSCFRDLRIAEALYAEKVASSKGPEERNALQRKVGDAFSCLRQKIKDDDDLFRSEKKELVEKANKVERYLLGEIKGYSIEGEEKINELPIKGAVFKEPFGDLLKSDPILLTHGGARLIEMDGDAVAILSVGSAMADNDDREDIAELQASASLGKLQSGEESVVANKLEKTYRRSSGSKGEVENMDVRRTSTIHINSMDFHKCGETVGTWFSSDGKRFFVAKGRIVSSQAKNDNRGKK